MDCLNKVEVVTLRRDADGSLVLDDGDPAVEDRAVVAVILPPVTAGPTPPVPAQIAAVNP